MTDDLKPLIQKLRGLVEKAPAGPWFSNDEMICGPDGDEIARCLNVIGGDPEAFEAEDVAAYITALDPSTVSRLLDAAEGERAAADVAVWAQTAVAAWQKWKLSPHDILAEQDLNRAMASLRDSLATKTLAASKAKEEEK